MLPSRHRLPVVLDVVVDGPRLHRRRRLVPEDLLDRLRYERAIGRELAPLIGVLGEQLAGPADQARRRLVPGAGEQHHVGEHLDRA